MSKLLFNKQPLVIDKTLAKLIGLNEAIVLQQIHYWIEINKSSGKNLQEGKHWVFRTVKEWQEDFPFWSIETIKRTLTKLRKKNILLTGNFNKMKIDRTIWYTINYTELKKIAQEQENEVCANALGQNDPMETEDENKKEKEKGYAPTIRSKCSNGKGQNDPMDLVKMTQPITRDYKEIKKEIKSINQSIKENLSKKEIDIAQKKKKDDGLIDSKNHESFLEKLKNSIGASNEQIKKAIERLDNQEKAGQNIKNFRSYLTKTVQSIKEEDTVRQMVNRFGQKIEPDKHKKIFNALLMS